jgi:integrase
MGIRIRCDNGKMRETWWARTTVKGAVRNVNLKVPIEGEPPRDELGNITLTLQGDAAFERSRRAAQKAFEAWKAESKTDPAEMVEKAYKARTGISLDGVPLAKLAEKWVKQKRGYTPTKVWAQAVETWFKRFATFAAAYARAHGGKKCETINDITPEIAAAWFDDIKRTFSWETVTKMMALMRGAYRRYATNGRTNPFEDIVIRNRESSNQRVPHKPLTAAEIERLFACARDDGYIYPLIVAAACTGMRIGDVCNLKWKDVDLEGGFIEVVTAKAGVRATIPIFGRLRDVLDDAAAIPADGRTASAFVFPLAAKQYARNPDGIYLAVKPYFAQAVYGGANEEPEGVNVAADGTAQIEPRALEEVIGGAGYTDAKRARIIEVYQRNKAGEKSIEIAAAMGIARSQVSMYLAEIEGLTGESLRPRMKAGKARANRKALVKQTRAKRAVGKRAASLYGWHSLRATFVVLAVEAGVPLASVQKVVGHTTADMTLQYFNPEKKHIAEQVREQMKGSVLDGGKRANGRGRKQLGAAGVPSAAAPNVEELLASLPREKRLELLKKLTATL